MPSYLGKINRSIDFEFLKTDAKDEQWQTGQICSIIAEKKMSDLWKFRAIY